MTGFLGAFLVELIQGVHLIKPKRQFPKAEGTKRGLQVCKFNHYKLTTKYILPLT